jgi:tetratricopeptide (TPR) repeat protein
VSDRLRALWSFGDLDTSEARFREQLTREATATGRAEVLTQLARVEGLRGAADAGERLLHEAETLAGESAAARARIDLERGRLRRSGGDPRAALPSFESAFASALEANELFVAVDAAHMAALAAPDSEGFETWTRKGIALAQDAEPSVRYWLGPLLNNLGWHYFEDGRHEDALEAFTWALRERERDPDSAEPIALARYAVAKTLRELGRPEEARPLLEQAVASANAAGRPDGWYEEELAETNVALGRDEEAAEHARLAVPLLEKDDPSFSDDVTRASRLRELARL